MQIEWTMKYPVFCFFMVCFLTVMVAPPFIGADAAQLWNKPDRAKSGKAYYNKRKPFEDADAPVLYNQTKRDRMTPSGRGSLNAIQAYGKVTMPGQKPSKLWETMAPSAARNRQADIDFALQQEYNIRKKVSAEMIKALRIRAQQDAAQEKKYQAELAAYRAEQDAIKQKKLEKKLQALGFLTSAARAYKSSGTYKRASRKDDSTGLKKPKRLFNDPNR